VPEVADCAVLCSTLFQVIRGRVAHLNQNVKN